MKVLAMRNYSDVARFLRLEPAALSRVPEAPLPPLNVADKWVHLNTVSNTDIPKRAANMHLPVFKAVLDLFN